MAKNSEWKEVKGSDFNDTFTFQKKGEILEGKYLGSHEVTTDLGKSTVHTVETKEGTFDFFGSGQLNWKLKAVEAGSIVKILYNGKVPAKVRIGNRKLMKEVHNFQLFTK